MSSGICPLNNSTSLPFLFIYFSSFWCGSNVWAAPRSCTQRPLVGVLAGCFGLSVWYGVPSTAGWCQDPEISGRLGQEEVGAALLRERDIWNSYSTLHLPKKRDSGGLFFSLCRFASCFSLSPEGEPEQRVPGKSVGPANPDDVGCWHGSSCGTWCAHGTP